MYSNKCRESAADIRRRTYREQSKYRNTTFSNSAPGVEPGGPISPSNAAVKSRAGYV